MKMVTVIEEEFELPTSPFSMANVKVFLRLIY
jgi:hypothetical protein